MYTTGRHFSTKVNQIRFKVDIPEPGTPLITAEVRIARSADGPERYPENMEGGLNSCKKFKQMEKQSYVRCRLDSTKWQL